MAHHDDLLKQALQLVRRYTIDSVNLAARGIWRILRGVSFLDRGSNV
jgi:hypothetical protein